MEDSEIDNVKYLQCDYVSEPLLGELGLYIEHDTVGYP